MEEDTRYRVSAESLREYCASIFQRLDVSPQDARITADVLVEADLRGIDSHGVARMGRYVNGIRDGMMIPRPHERVLSDLPAAGAWDAGAGLGQPVSHRAMENAIAKARQTGVGFVTVRNSNHYGIAGYYALMALKEDMIGMSMTNADVLVVPTFGRDALLGTNPIAVAMPAGEELPFVLDMATSVVPRGKLEVHERLGKPVPLGWATDEWGKATEDPASVLRNFLSRAGGGLLPLGGEGELHGGHKGYGLAMLVELLCGVLAGAGFLGDVYPKSAAGKPLPSNLGHVFAAIRVDAFRPLTDFKASMDEAVRRLHGSAKAVGQERIWVHGEKEFLQAEENRRLGIPLHEKVFMGLRKIGDEVGIPCEL